MITRLSVEQAFGPNHKIVTGRLFKDFNGRGCTAAQRVLTDFGVCFELDGVDGEPLFDLVIVAAGKSITASALTEDEVREYVGETAPGSELSDALDEACEGKAGWSNQVNLPEEDVFSETVIPAGAYNFQLKKHMGRVL